ncbi:hypothetical protein CABS01_03456 [Colletotrichum abscissum]|uniref:Uncharacterized protein n=2 Tax=Colletotrichum acutatum species complex TaxID=2707335 RepID=A0A9Q0AWU9_9PEZI|nr:uncharacterized protein CLUP02_13129 [Colletotrichum lupini]XP_060392750.1 uncharacterized protein CABS01_03456 [Colletotrichum abscissum]KAI3533282.1 hypothetical protein CABS02_13622 [Colletotrichum abscissum]KAK1478154.1 hypothetical protein CABS01_03456 [Colletotrichum abscissum]UQC87611.1 hypothetical protein CLUP02_13129 [Colletotrichum lupini]
MSTRLWLEVVVFLSSCLQSSKIPTSAKVLTLFMPQTTAA